MKTKGAKRGIYGNNVDMRQFESLCGIMCTEREICDFFDVSRDTLNRWCKQNYDGATFEEVLRAKSAKGKASLRRYQFELAQKNPSMAIWLGKQYLGQTERIEETSSSKVEIINDLPKGEIPQ